MDINAAVMFQDNFSFSILPAFSFAYILSQQC